MALNSICADCGHSYTRDKTGARCPDCKPKDDGARRAGTKTTAQRGYGARWQRLSKKARELQPFCTDCGATSNLSGDHSVEAWERHDKGLAIRLQDIDVVCLRCNGERGAARGERASNEWRSGPASEPEYGT